MPQTRNAEILLRSSNLFTATKSRPMDGYIAIAGQRIISVGPGSGLEYVHDHTKIYLLGDKVICPGFSDVHCFFTGYVLGLAGLDLSACTTASDVFAAMKAYGNEVLPEKPLLAHGLNNQIDPPGVAGMDCQFGSRAVVLFGQGGETCWMNTIAIQRYQFTPSTCYPEAIWRLLRDILNDREFIVPKFKEYIKMLNSRGITSIKEMGFDDFYGFTDILQKLEEDHELSMRVHFMSQPVGSPANIPFGLAMRDRFKGDFVRFSGYNQMTDGSISQMEGDLKKPYNCAPKTCCAKNINYAAIEKETLAADAEGLRFSLHAQGDAAISKVIDIFEKCARKKDGKIANRHAITDLEFSDPSDLERMGKLGVIAEIYPQIMSIADRSGKLAMISDKIGLDRGKYYWNRRKMKDSGVMISCGTDLPLLIDDIPESIYHACGAFFPEGGESFNADNTLTVAELLTAWTFGGQYNLGREAELGTLEAGKLADIAVLDANVFERPLSDMRQVKVCLTIVNGQEVYNRLS